MTSSNQSKSHLQIRSRRSHPTPAETLARHAIEAILSKKGHHVSVMDMRRVTGVADYFVLCTGDSDVQIRAIADAVREHIREHCSEKPWHTEGYDHLQWVLLDYVNVVVHVFDRERRDFYDLERLWGDAPIENVSDDAPTADMLQHKA